MAHLAAMNDQVEVLKYLLASGLSQDFERKTNDVSPMAMAALTGHLGIVQFLIEFQNSNDNENQHALRTEALASAIEGSHLEIVKLLCENGASTDMLARRDTTALHIAAAIGSIEIVEYLLEAQHVDLNVRNSTGVTAFMYAATTGRANIVELLIVHGAPVDEAIENSTDPVQNGTTSAHFAALYGQVDVLTVLLEHGADLNAKTLQGTSVLRCARNSGSMAQAAGEEEDATASAQTVEFLLAHGALED